MRTFALLLLMLASALGQTNIVPPSGVVIDTNSYVWVPTSSQLRGGTNFVNWSQVESNFSQTIVTVNVTNQPDFTPRNTVVYSWDAWCRVPVSIDSGKTWNYQLVNAHCSFSEPATLPVKLYGKNITITLAPP